MPVYAFKCEKCEQVFEYFYKAGEAPSHGLECEKCGAELYRVWECNFELRGSWPGKDIKAGYQSDRSTTELSYNLDKYDDAKKEAQRVLAERRKGKKNFKEFERHNKPAVERYKKNLKKGIKGNDDPQKTFTLRDLQKKNSNI